MNLKSLAGSLDKDAFLQHLVKTKETFTIQASNYSLSVTMENGETMKLNKKDQNRWTFFVRDKIIADLKNFIAPNVTAEDVLYYKHNIRNDFSIPHAIEVDLKAAYLNILLTEGYIQKETVASAMRLPKADRLAAVGMLASKKHLFPFKKGIPQEPTVEQNQFAGFFFFAVQQTFEIMSRVKQIAGNNYFFHWVDGAYIHPDPATERKIKSYLKSVNLPFKIQPLTNFKAIRKSEFIDITFNRSDGAFKNHRIPIESKEFMNDFRYFILKYSPKKAPHVKQYHKE